MGPAMSGRRDSTSRGLLNDLFVGLQLIAHTVGNDGHAQLGGERPVPVGAILRQAVPASPGIFAAHQDHAQGAKHTPDQQFTLRAESDQFMILRFAAQMQREDQFSAGRELIVPSWWHVPYPHRRHDPVIGCVR